MRSFPLSKVYGLLEPGPVVLLTTAYQRQYNIMTMSWHTMLEFAPPLIGCVISSGDYSFERVMAAGKCVIAVPTVELAFKVVQIGNSSGRDIDKFKAFGLTAVSASLIDAPLIAECYANLECKVIDTSMVDKYNFFVLEVVKALINKEIKEPQTIHHRGKGLFMVAGETIKFPSKMR